MIIDVLLTNWPEYEVEFDAILIFVLFTIQTIAIDKLTRCAYRTKSAKDRSKARVKRVDGISLGGVVRFSGDIIRTTIAIKAVVEINILKKNE